MGWRPAGLVLAAALVCAAAVVPIGLAGKPTITREVVDETFADGFLTDACGVPVETHVAGHLIIRTFTDSNGRLIEVFTVNVSVTSTSDEGTFRFRDVGADVTRITHDGIVLQIIGKLPFWFNGTTWEDPITGEVLKEPTGSDLFESMVQKACAALAP
jgi:hypothetical protein